VDAEAILRPAAGGCTIGEKELEMFGVGPTEFAVVAVLLLIPVGLAISAVVRNRKREK
jgi:hypothetical protein